jgi:xanthine dehydrogenase YagT iron-sulfur-binding subunit
MAAHQDEESKPLTSLQKLSRRAFLSRAGAVGVATATAAVAPGGGG